MKNEYSHVLLKVPAPMTKEEAENIIQSGEWKKYEELQEADEELKNFADGKIEGSLLDEGKFGTK